jgi:hypothetical protein
MSVKYKNLKINFEVYGVLLQFQHFIIQTISSLTNLDHNSPHISSMYITPHTPNKFSFRYIIYSSLFYFIIQP